MRKLILCVLVFFAGTALAQQQKAMEQFTKTAAGCKNMACINKAVTEIDINLVALLGLRLAYMEQAHKLNRGLTDTDTQARKRMQAFDTIGNVAERAGYPSTYIRNIFYHVFQQTSIYLNRKSGRGFWRPNQPLPNRRSQDYHFGNVQVDKPE